MDEDIVEKLADDMRAALRCGVIPDNTSAQRDIIARYLLARYTITPITATCAVCGGLLSQPHCGRTP